MSKRTNIYFVVEAGGRIKIGRSDNPLKRMEQIKYSAGNFGEGLKILATVRGPRAWEYKLHRVFKSARIKGEWFKATPELKSTIAHIKETGCLPRRVRTEMRKRGEPPIMANFRIPEEIAIRLKRVTDRTINPYAPTITQLVLRGLELSLREVERKA